MLRTILAGWAAAAFILASTSSVQGQLPSLPPSLPKPAADSGVLPVPAALSGVKAGQSETAVSVEMNVKPAISIPDGGTFMLGGRALNPAGDDSEQNAASTIPTVSVDGSQDTAASAETLDDTGRLNARLISATPTNDGPKLTASSRRNEAPRTYPKQADTLPSAEQTSFKTVGPTIQVETVGPRSIAINKPAEFEIRVTNSGSQEARGINVEANFPEFVDLMSARPSAGTFDQQNGAAQPRLKWRIENLAPGRSESAILQVTPRSAMLFDFQVQWVADPLRGQAAIQVTEPKLDMRIAGPAEVHYGETAIYTVTIRNPGTGIAENVEIMLSEDLGGQRATVGNIQPGEERTFEVELIPGEAGTLSLEAFAKADTLEHSASKEIIVRRADLELVMDGPPAAYAGTTCIYRVLIKNTGDAIARDVVAAAVLPSGAKYVGGIEAAEVVQSGLRWNVGNLPIGEERRYEIHCVYNHAGELRMETGVRAADDLAATHTVQTHIAALADLVLDVESPKGPLPIQEQVTYLIRVKNRGTSAGKQIQLAMQFSEGIEPVGASGSSYDIEPGQITFVPIESLDIDQEVTIRVQAIASESGNHRFRAVLTCDDPISEEIAQGTSHFYGDEIHAAGKPIGGRSASGDSGLRR